MAYTADAVREEMQQHVKSVAALAPEDGRKAALAFAASILQLPYERVRKFFYGNANCIHAHEADQVRAYVKQAEELIEARQEYEQKRRDYLANASPFMARLAPPALPEDTAERVAAPDLHRGAR